MAQHASKSAIVVGAGIAGLAAAVGLARTGWSVTVLERATGLRGGAYVVGFSGIGAVAAERLGLSPMLHARASPWHSLQQVDGEGRVLARLSARAQRSFSGRRVISILRGDLEAMLHDVARETADIRYGQTVTAIDHDDESVSAVLDDGSRLTCDLLIGADGAHSRVRTLVFGHESEWRYDFGAKVVSYEISDPPSLVREQTTMLTSVGRSLGLYPQRDGGLSAFFTFQSIGDDGYDAYTHLQNAYGDLGWVWPEVIALSRDASSVFFDDISQIRMRTWHRDRVVLLGDSAWAVSLLAGAGSSLAVGGALALADELSRCAGIADALQRWERYMRPQAISKQVLGRMTRQLFLPSSKFAVDLRIAGLRVASLWNRDSV